MTILFDSSARVKSRPFGSGIAPLTDLEWEIVAMHEPPCCSPSEADPCRECVILPGERVDPWDAEAPPELWPDDCDDHLWNLGPDPDAADEGSTAEDLRDFHEWTRESEAREYLDASERLSLVELILRQSEFFFSWNNPAGSLLADAMNALAMRVSLVNATTPAEYWARIGVEDEAARAALIAEGYDRAMEESGERAACLGSFGHPA